MNTPLNVDDLEYIDRYIKRTITNVKHSYFHNLYNDKTARDVSIEEVSNNKDYAITIGDPPSEIYVIHESRIPICDPNLSEALNSLTERQRTVLLQNIVLQIPIKEIAGELGISVRVTVQHKQRAISAMKRSLHNEAK